MCIGAVYLTSVYMCKCISISVKCVYRNFYCVLDQCINITITISKCIIARLVSVLLLCIRGKCIILYQMVVGSVLY